MLFRIAAALKKPFWANYLIIVVNVFSSCYRQYRFSCLKALTITQWLSLHHEKFPEGLRYETDGDACRNFCIRPLKETNLGVTQAFCDP